MKASSVSGRTWLTCLSLGFYAAISTAACTQSPELGAGATTTSASAAGGAGGSGAHSPNGVGGSAGAACPDPREEDGVVALGFVPELRKVGVLSFYYYAPASPRALIFTFHGSGGDAKIWFELTEPQRLMARLVEAGYAVAALDSISGHATRDKKQWDLSGPVIDNPDFKNVVNAIGLLKNNNIVPADIPIVLMGGSNGGAFASAASTGLDAKALVLHISRGLKVAFNTPNTPPPTAWVVGRQDDIVTFDTAALNIPAIEQAGVPYAFLINEPVPVAADSMTRIAGVSSSVSKTFFEKVKEAGLLDGCDRQLASPESNHAWAGFLPSSDELLREQVRHQLLELHAGHTITSDFGEQLVSFLDDHLK
jgi:dienelactone hydrolase